MYAECGITNQQTGSGVQEILAVHNLDGTAQGAGTGNEPPDTAGINSVQAGQSDVSRYWPPKKQTGCRTQTSVVNQRGRRTWLGTLMKTMLFLLLMFTSSMGIEIDTGCSVRIQNLQDYTLPTVIRLLDIRNE